MLLSILLESVQLAFPVWLAAAGIGLGVASLVSGIIGSNKANATAKEAAKDTIAAQGLANQANIAMTQQTNEANLNMTRETNAANFASVNAYNQAQLEQQKLQNQFNLDMWNRTNQYNSPANQVKLYRQAGLNPATLAGGWTDAQTFQSAGTNLQPYQAQQAPSMISPQVSAQGNINAAQMLAQGAVNSQGILAQSFKDASSALDQFVNFKKTEVETGMLQSRTLQEIDESNERIAKSMTDRYWMDKNGPKEFDKMQSEIDLNRANAYNIDNKTVREKVLTNIDRLQHDLLQRQFEYLAENPKLVNDSIRASINNLVQQARTGRAQENLFNAQTTTEGVKQTNLYADTNLKNNQADLADYQGTEQYFKNQEYRKYGVDSDKGWADKAMSKILGFTLYRKDSKSMLENFTNPNVKQLQKEMQDVLNDIKNDPYGATSREYMRYLQQSEMQLHMMYGY